MYGIFTGRAPDWERSATLIPVVHGGGRETDLTFLMWRDREVQVNLKVLKPILKASWDLETTVGL